MQLQGKNEILWFFCWVTLRTQGGFALEPAPCRAAGTRVFLTSGGQFQLLDVRAPTVRHDGGPAIHVTISLFLVAVLAIKGCDGTVPTVARWPSVPVVKCSSGLLDQ